MAQSYGCILGDGITKKNTVVFPKLPKINLMPLRSQSVVSKYSKKSFINSGRSSIGVDSGQSSPEHVRSSIKNLSCKNDLQSKIKLNSRYASIGYIFHQHKLKSIDFQHHKISNPADDSKLDTFYLTANDDCYQLESNRFKPNKIAERI